MTFTARPYQDEDTAAIYQSWANGARNVCYQCPTGGGKTFVGKRIITNYQGSSAVLAHRSELVLQQSMTLATLGQRHRIIASKPVTQFIMREHKREFGRHFYDPNSRVGAIAVDTLRARYDELKPWCNQVTLWELDECHHLLRENKWGDVIGYFPQASGLGVTATTNRADGKGIGRHAEGLFDDIVYGPDVRTLIDAGYLCDYKIYAPPSDFDLNALKMGGTGDFTRDSMVKETRKSHIVGDIVEHYKRILNGKRAIVFAVDIQSAGEIAAAFVAAGIRAASVSGKSSDAVRQEMVRRFRNGDLEILINVDLFGEGFDVPACEGVIMARPTQSLPLYLQMFGRALRVFDGKLFGIIIDHVSNVKRHLLPDSPREWNLDNRNKRARSSRLDDAMPITTCISCHRSREAISATCPYCGYKAEPGGRGSPEQVDGDLCELDYAALMKMKGERERVLHHINGTASGISGIKINHHNARRDAQIELQKTMAWWAGVGRTKGMEDAEMYRRFYHMFGVDVLGAQVLSAPETIELTQKIRERIEI